MHGQLASIDPNLDVFAIDNIMDIGEGEPLFGSFEYETTNLSFDVLLGFVQHAWLIGMAA